VGNATVAQFPLGWVTIANAAIWYNFKRQKQI